MKKEIHNSAVLLKALLERIDFNQKKGEDVSADLLEACHSAKKIAQVCMSEYLSIKGQEVKEDGEEAVEVLVNLFAGLAGEVSSILSEVFDPGHVERTLAENKEFTRVYNILIKNNVPADKAREEATEIVRNKS